MDVKEKRENMLENLRRKSLVKTYNDPIHQVFFDHSWAIYLDSCSIAQHKQKLSKKIGMSFPKKYFTTPNPECFTIPPIGFWRVVERLNGVQFNMIYCPKGTFKMGHEDQEYNPPREEKIERPFLLGETEITQELYQAVMNTNPSLNTKNSQNPVEKVSWLDAIKFCNELSRLQSLELCYTENKRSLDYGWDCDFSKNGYRLPREKEWEYAAKAGTENRWVGTDKEEDLGEYAWFGEDYWNGSTYPVKQKKPNEWGFYDMSGNVYEWCWDKYDPKDSDISARRINRGGSWISHNDSHLFSARRSNGSPNDRFASLGFRVCRSIVS